MRAAVLIFFLAVAAYATSLGNGFAYDDEGILTQNPTVTAGDWRGALGRSWWPLASPGAGLYRPVTSASFAAEWGLFGGAPLSFHLVNVLVHALVSLLVLALLLALGATRPGALVGAALFAIHPVHTEAVANVVGRAELFAAAFYLAACILYWRGRDWTGAARLVRLVALGVLYFLSLASKEIGVSLPAVLLVLELRALRAGPEGSRSIPAGLRREAATWAILLVALLAYLSARFVVLGSVVGERAAPIFELVGPTARVLTAIGLWFQYLRLLVFPLDLVSSYDPAVLFPSEGLDLAVVLGFIAIALLAGLAVRTWKDVPLVDLGIAFFTVTILPVSNLFFSTGTVLAERTLYLPSVGLALAAAGVTPLVLALRPPLRRVVLAGAALVALGLFARTAARNPTWASSFAVIETLNEEHPESWRAFRARAQGLVRVGRTADAAAEWEQAVRLAPTDYTLLVEAGDFFRRSGNENRATALFRAAVAADNGLANAYQLLSAHLLRQGLGREGHAAALAGLINAGNDRELWELVSESYVMRGDLPAAVRAREAALGVGPAPAATWLRMGELHEAVGDTAAAADARAAAERQR